MKYLILLLLLTGCAGMKPDPNRAGCYMLDGKARYGTFTQYIKGAARGVHVYIGENLKGKVHITCNEETTEILISPMIDLPEWIEDVSVPTE